MNKRKRQKEVKHRITFLKLSLEALNLPKQSDKDLKRVAELMIVAKENPSSLVLDTSFIH